MCVQVFVCALRFSHKLLKTFYTDVSDVFCKNVWFTDSQRGMNLFFWEIFLSCLCGKKVQGVVLVSRMTQRSGFVIVTSVRKILTMRRPCSQVYILVNDNRLRTFFCSLKLLFWTYVGCNVNPELIQRLCLRWSSESPPECCTSFTLFLFDNSCACPYFT